MTGEYIQEESDKQLEEPGCEEVITYTWKDNLGFSHIEAEFCRVKCFKKRCALRNYEVKYPKEKCPEGY